MQVAGTQEAWRESRQWPDTDYKPRRMRHADFLARLVTWRCCSLPRLRLVRHLKLLDSQRLIRYAPGGSALGQARRGSVEATRNHAQQQSESKLHSNE